MNFLSANIKYLRSKLAMNQAEFGQLFGCTRDNIASYERGSEPKLETVYQIVKYFHTTFEEIYTTDISNKITQAFANEPPEKYRRRPPKEDCEMCKQKDSTIAAQAETIKAQAITIDNLKEKIDTLTGIEGEQKRKAG